MSRSGSGPGMGFNSVELTTLKMAVFAPMPSASVSTATAVKPGFFSNWRKANLRSFMARGQWSVVPCRSQGKIPKPKPQAPKKSQASSSKPPCGGSRLEIEIWGLLGIWVLGLDFSFAPERLHWIDLRRATRGRPAGQQRDSKHEHRDGGERQWISGAHAVKEAGHNTRQRERTRQTNDQA